MAIAKTHPANCLSWLYVEGPEASAAMDRLLDMVKAQTALDKHASGEPEPFAAWAIRQIRPLAKRPAIAQQISDRRSKLEKELAGIQGQLQTSINTLQAKADRAIAALAVLDELDPPAETSEAEA